MKLFAPVTQYIISLTDQNFRKAMIGALAAISIVTVGVIYFVYQTSSNRVNYIKQVHKLAHKSGEILANNDLIQIEEDRIQELLEKNKDFNIKTYFEQFCRKHNVTPDPNWETAVNPIEGNDKFEEVILSATFNNENTRSLVTILDALDKNEIVYIAGLSVKKDKGKISFDLTIATKKLRRLLEE